MSAAGERLAAGEDRLIRHGFVAHLFRSGEAALPGGHILQAAALQLRTARDLLDGVLVTAVEGVGVQVAAQRHRHPGEHLVSGLQNGFQLLLAAGAVGAVFQMDGAHAHALAVHVQLCQDGEAAADTALTVKVPVVLLRQTDHLGLLDGPAGEDSVAVEALGVLAVHQFDEFQAEDVVHTQALR